MPPDFNTAIVFDGSTIVHGIDIWKPWIEPPDHDTTSELRYAGNEKWDLYKKGKLIRKYDTTDLRISFVWFTECEYNEEEVREHEEQKNQHTVDYVLEKFIKDMREKGILKENEEVPSRLDLGLLIMKNYIIYPIQNHNPVLPINQCMLLTKDPKTIVQSTLNYLLSFVC